MTGSIFEDFCSSLLPVPQWPLRSCSRSRPLPATPPGGPVGWPELWFLWSKEATRTSWRPLSCNILQVWLCWSYSVAKLSLPRVDFWYWAYQRVRVLYFIKQKLIKSHWTVSILFQTTSWMGADRVFHNFLDMVQSQKYQSPRFSPTLSTTPPPADATGKAHLALSPNQQHHLCAKMASGQEEWCKWVKLEYIHSSTLDLSHFNLRTSHFHDIVRSPMANVSHRFFPPCWSLQYP